MKPRTTIYLALILVVLVGIAVLFQISQRRSFSSAGKPAFPDFSLAKADGIDIQGKTKPVSLRKQGKRWVVATEGWHEADPKAAQQILESVDKFTGSTLISTAKDKQAAFQVDSSGTTVRVLQGTKAVAAFIVGKAGADYMSCYARPVGQNQVYLVPAYLPSMINRGGETWRNTMILDLDPAKVTGYTTTNAKETTTLEKDPSGTWKITAPITAPAKSDVMSMVLRGLAQVRAVGFADSTLTEPALGLAPDTANVVVRTADGSSYKITIGASNDQRQSYTRIDNNPTVFLVPRGRWGTVFRPAESLRAPEAGSEAASGSLPGAAPGTPAGGPPGAPRGGPARGAPPVGTK
jgi:hypothetical protein